MSGPFQKRSVRKTDPTIKDSYRSYIYGLDPTWIIKELSLFFIELIQFSKSIRLYNDYAIWLLVSGFDNI